MGGGGKLRDRQTRQTERWGEGWGRQIERDRKMGREKEGLSDRERDR